MAQRKPETRTMKISDVRSQFNALTNDVYRTHDRVIVEKNGIPVAVLVSPDDLRVLARDEEIRERGWAAVERIGAAFADVPEEEILREIFRAQGKNEDDIAFEPLDRSS